MNPLEELSKTNNDYEVHFQRFRDANVITWCVTLKDQQPNLKGRGDTLEDAIQDLSRQAELKEFESQLQHAKLGTSTVGEMKEKIRGIL